MLKLTLFCKKSYFNDFFKIPFVVVVVVGGGGGGVRYIPLVRLKYSFQKSSNQNPCSLSFEFVISSWHTWSLDVWQM